MRSALEERARAAGVALSYIDNTGTPRDAPDESVEAVLAAMTLPEDAGAEPEVRVILAGSAGSESLPSDWHITLEGCGTLEGRGTLPALPVGRHLAKSKGRRIWLIAAPPALPLPSAGWGVTLPLYGLGGPGGAVGDYGDLAEAVVGVGGLGAAFLGINPVHAGVGHDPGRISPYSPTHRRRFATGHIRPARSVEPSGGALIDYGHDLPARFAALEAEFAEKGADPAFEVWRAHEGAALERFVTHEVLAERFGPGWNTWPSVFRDPESPDVARFAEEAAPRRAFHAWLQYRAEAQLGAAADAAKGAGMTHGLYMDLAVGTDPYGAETWAERRTFAYGVSLGAPPDAFSEGGQNWSIAPFNPRALVQDGFEALAATLRAQLQFAGMLRIDHILGFERAFWVPDGLPGTYVQMPREAMLAVLRIEAARAGAVIVGEDLGNVPDGLREALAKSGILGCQVAMFEPGRAGADYLMATLASFGTHDLPTWAGWTAGRDIEARAGLGMMGPDEVDAARSERARDVARLREQIAGSDADDLHRFLAASNARLVALQAEDILEVADQPNLPGTVDEYPNWRHPLPVAAKDLVRDPRLQRVAKILSSFGR